MNEFNICDDRWFFRSYMQGALGEWIPTNNGFPLGTFSINLIGWFSLGWFLTFASQKEGIRPEFTLMIGTGFIGSFTTFSTFGNETINLIKLYKIKLAIIYVFASIIVGIIAVMIGLYI